MVFLFFKKKVDKYLKVALTGHTGFLGKELLKILKEKNIEVRCYNLRSLEKINIFLNDLKEIKFNAIINCAAAIKPITKSDFYINENLPRDIQLNIKDRNYTKYIHISSINVLDPYLRDLYTSSKKFAENSLDHQNVIIVRPSLIIDHTYNLSNPLFEKLNLFSFGYCPMVYPGNYYAPINLNTLAKYIVDLIDNLKISFDILNVQGFDNLYLWEIFDKFCKFRNRKAIKIYTGFLNYILPKILKNVFYRNNKLQNFLHIDRTTYEDIIKM